MDADNDDRPHYHIFAGDYNDIVGLNVIDFDHPCTNNDDTRCFDPPVVVVPLDEYRNLVAAARDRHPANQQRGPDPATRADNYICSGCGYYSCICLLAADS